MFNRIFSGTMNRKRYIICNIGLAVVAILIIIAMAVCFMASGATEGELLSSYSNFIAVPTIIICTAVSVVFDVKRLNHIGADNRLAVIPAVLSLMGIIGINNEFISNAVSVLNSIIFLGLCIVPGKARSSIS